MRILCVIPSYWPAFQFGGPIFSVHNLNKALIKQGVDLTVYTTNVGLKGEVEINKESLVDNVPVTYFAFNSLFEFMGNTGWQFSIPLMHALKKNITSFDLVYIVAVWNFPCTAAAYVARKYDVPYVISPRGTLYPETMANKSWKKRLYWRLVAEKDLEAASAIHYTTEDEAERCHAALRLTSKKCVVPNGIDLTECMNEKVDSSLFLRKFPHLAGKRIILFLGRLSWKKGLDLLTEAFANIARVYPNIHLVIAGIDMEGYKPKLMTILKLNDLLCADFSSSDAIRTENAKVTIVGELEGEMKFSSYKAAELFVLSSRSENFGMSVAEAMATGLPVIISDQVGIAGDARINQACSVIPLEVIALTRETSRLLGDHSARKKLAIKGRAFVSAQYDVMITASNLLMQFREIAAHGI